MLPLRERGDLVAVTQQLRLNRDQMLELAAKSSQTFLM